MQLPSMCLSPLRKCHRGKTLPSRIERVSRTLAKDFVSWSSVRTGSGASGKSPSILFTKASGRLLTSITEAYLNRVSSASSQNCHSSPLGESLLYARNALLPIEVSLGIRQYWDVSIPVHVCGEECKDVVGLVFEAPYHLGSFRQAQC